MGEIKYSIIYSGRRSLGIVVSPDRGVIVRAPERMPLKTIEEFVESRSGWIQKYIGRFSGMTRLNSDLKYVQGEEHLLMGKKLLLKIKVSARSFVSQYDNVIEVGLPVPGDNRKVKYLIDKWYRKVATDSFTNLLQIIILKFSDYRFTPSSLAVRSLKSKWGSCSSKGRITLSTELIKLDERFQEYVIIHELCHLKYHNHGRNFYELLEKLIPDYKEIRKELRNFSTR